MLKLVVKSIILVSQWVVVERHQIFKDVNFCSNLTSCCFSRIKYCYNGINFVGQGTYLFHQNIISDKVRCGRTCRRWCSLILMFVDIFGTILNNTCFLDNFFINQVIKLVHHNHSFSSHHYQTLFKYITNFLCIWETSYLHPRIKHVTFDDIYPINWYLFLECKH